MSTPPISTQPQANEFLRPFKPTLSGAFRGAFADWGNMLMKAPMETAGLSTYIHRRYIHDRTVFHLNKAEVEGTCPGLRLRKVRGLFVAILNDRMMLKLKKLDIALRSKNIQTGQTMAFDVQGSLLPSDLGRVTNATSGYVPDVFSGRIVDLVVVCWDDGNRLWEVALEEVGGEGDGPVLTIPAAPVAPTEGGRRRTKVIKPDRGKRQSE